jgi:hypothetical protein
MLRRPRLCDSTVLVALFWVFSVPLFAAHPARCQAIPDSTGAEDGQSVSDTDTTAQGGATESQSVMLAAVLEAAGSLDGPTPKAIRIPSRGLQVQETAAPAALGEAFSLIAEIAVERARRNGLELLRGRLEEAVCSWTYKTSQVQVFPNVCMLIRSSELEQLANQGDLLRARFAQDLLVLVESRLPDPEERTIGYVLQPATRTALTTIFDSLGDPRGRLSDEDAWVVLDAILNANWSKVSEQDGEEIRNKLDFLKAGLYVARAYIAQLQMGSDPQVRIRVPDLIRLLINKGNVEVKGLDGEVVGLDVKVKVVGFDEGLKEKIRIPANFQRVARWATLAVNAYTAETERRSPDVRARLRFTLDLVMTAAQNLLADRVGEGYYLVAHDLALAALDGDLARLLSVAAETASQELFDFCETGDRRCSQRVAKAAALLAGIAGYAGTFDDSEVTSSTDLAELAKERRAARKEALESLIDATTNRVNRGGDWVFSLGANVGLLLAGQQNLRVAAPDSDDTQDIYSQLSLPVGLAIQRLPSGNREDGRRRRAFGFHSMVTLVDLGQYVAWEDELGSADPELKSLAAPGVQLGLIWGKPNNFVTIGLQAAYAPDLFEIDLPEGPERTGGWRYGLAIQYFVPLFDFN